MNGNESTKAKLDILVGKTKGKSTKKASKNKRTKKIGKIELRKAESFPALHSFVKFKVHGLSSYRGGKHVIGEVVKHITDPERDSKFVEVKDKTGRPYHKRVNRIVAVKK